ncbi:MAG: hypothetical protein JWL77_2586 [Chthonomonadaceae bacterium]|nr:hypothetical protein [Chthonomonadaceae bacterium]
MLPHRYMRVMSRYERFSFLYGLIAIALWVVPCMGQNRNTAAPPGSSPTNHCSSRPDKRLPVHHSLSNYISPDGKYVAHIQEGEGDTADLWICKAPLSGKSLSLKHALLSNVIETDGLVWVPGRPHTLVFATGGIYGKASLSLWKGGTHLEMLVPVKHPDDEAFELNSISADGRMIYYAHWTKDQLEAANWGAHGRHQHLTLPR